MELKTNLGAFASSASTLRRVPWVGTQLAKWFGLSTLDQAIVAVDEFVEIRFLNGNPAQLGPALVTRAVKGDSWSGEPRQLTKLQNSDDISRLVVFDTWILNRDRHSANRQNRDNVFLSAEVSPLELLAIRCDDRRTNRCRHPWRVAGQRHRKVRVS